ncbi:AraC family transcriptional regulator, partial [Paracoccus sp. PXZ]
MLLRPTAGLATIMFPRHNHVLPAGRIAFIPAGTAFSLKPPPEVRGLALLIPPALCQGQSLPRSFSHGLPATGDAALL